MGREDLRMGIGAIGINTRVQTTMRTGTQSMVRETRIDMRRRPTTKDIQRTDTPATGTRSTSTMPTERRIDFQAMMKEVVGGTDPPL